MRETLAREPRGGVPDDGLSARLEATLEKEAELLNELRQVFRRQREALVRGDAERLDDGVFAATRLMRTLDEARASRRKVTVGLVGADVDFLELDDVLSHRASTELLGAREAVLQAAQGLRQEVAVLRSSLHVLLDDNRRCLDALLGVGAPPATAGGDVPGQATEGGRQLLDRRA